MGNGRIQRGIKVLNLTIVLSSHKMVKQNHVHDDCSLPMSIFSDTVIVPVSVHYSSGPLLFPLLYIRVYISHIRYKIMPCAEQHNIILQFFVFHTTQIYPPYK